MMPISIVFTSLIVTCGFLLNIMSSSVVSNTIGNTAHFGDFSSFIQGEYILGLSISCGVDLAIDKYLPNFIYYKKYNAIEIFNRFYFSILRIIFIVFFILLSMIYIYRYHYNISFIEDARLFIDNLYLLITSFFIAINSYYCKILRICGHLLIATVNYVLTPFLLFTIFAYCASSKETYVFAQLYSLAWIITFFITMVLVHIYVKFNVMMKLKYFTQKISFKPACIKKTFQKNILKDSLFLLLSSTSDNSFGFTLIAINIVIYNSHDVGLAAAVGSLCLIYLLIIKTISSIYRPNLKLKILGDKDSAVDFIKKYTRIGIILSTIVTAIYIITGEKILVMIYGAEYRDAYLPLLITAIAFCFVEGFTIHKITLELHNSKNIAIIVMLSNIFSLILVIILGALFGLIGALSGFLIGRVYYIFQINKKFSGLIYSMRSEGEFSFK